MTRHVDVGKSTGRLRAAGRRPADVGKSTGRLRAAGRRPADVGKSTGRLRAAGRRPVLGFTLLEILIALVVLAFGMLALARGMGRASQSEVEAFQRAQAMTLAQEMSDRLNDNLKQAAQYVGDYVPGPVVEDCSGAASVVERDSCEWRNRLLGVDTLDGQRAIGAPMAARGCITSPAPNIYIVAVAWQGILPSDAPDSACGANAFDREENRRVFSTVIQVATLGA